MLSLMPNFKMMMCRSIYLASARLTQWQTRWLSIPSYAEGFFSSGELFKYMHGVISSNANLRQMLMLKTELEINLF